MIEFIPFPRVLVLCEMQSVSSRIWTRVAVSISYDDKHCTTVAILLCTSNIIGSKKKKRKKEKGLKLKKKKARSRQCVVLCLQYCTHQRDKSLRFCLVLWINKLSEDGIKQVNLRLLEDSGLGTIQKMVSLMALKTVIFVSSLMFYHSKWQRLPKALVSLTIRLAILSSRDALVITEPIRLRL